MDELIKAARKDMEEYASYAEKIAEKNLIKILEAFPCGKCFYATFLFYHRIWL